MTHSQLPSTLWARHSVCPNVARHVDRSASTRVQQTCRTLHVIHSTVQTYRPLGAQYTGYQLETQCTILARCWRRAWLYEGSRITTQPRIIQVQLYTCVYINCCSDTILVQNLSISSASIKVNNNVTSRTIGCIYKMISTTIIMIHCKQLCVSVMLTGGTLLVILLVYCCHEFVVY